MSSLSHAQRARLGVFMTVGFFLLLVFIAIPVGFRLRDKQKTYYCVFKGESLSGLEQSAIVKFHGIPVGKVEKLNYDPKNIDEVRVTLRIQDDFPVKKDMVAQTGMMGITGLMYMEIMGGSNESPLLEEGALIPTRQSMIAAITGKAEGIMNKIELLLNHLNTVTDPDSMARVHAILANVQSVTADIKDIGPQIKNVAAAARTTMENVTAITADVRGVTGNLNETIDSDKLTGILVSIDSTAASLKKLSETLELTIRQSREDFTVSMENLRETLENANDITKMLAENPSLLIRGENQKERRIQ